MKAVDLNPCLCPKEVASLLGISERGAVRLMSSGQLASFRVGKLWRTTRDHVAAYQAKAYEAFRFMPAA